MKYLEDFKWDKIKSDLQDGLKEGVVAVKKGAMVVRKKSGDMTAEARRQYKLMTLKSKAHRSISELGAKVYDLMRAKAKNPAIDAKVKGAVAEIRKIEAQIAALEKKTKESLKKTFKKAA